MKKLLSLLLAGSMLFSLAACGEKTDKTSEKSEDVAVDENIVVSPIAAGSYHTLAIKSDGTVVATGNNFVYSCDVEDWNNIVAVSASEGCSVGLKSDGTVVTTYKDGRKYFEKWKDIIQISSGGMLNTVGLKSDGTVVSFGTSGDVREWNDIVTVSTGYDYTVGVKSDGTVIATEYDASMFENSGRCDVGEWTDIVAVSAGFNHTVGLKSDGTVVAVGDFGSNAMFSWQNIIAIEAGYNLTAGLKSDGTVELAGANYPEVSEWTDIVAISAGDYYLVGLKSDGTVVAVGDNNEGECNVSNWSDIKLPE